LTTSASAQVSDDIVDDTTGEWLIASQDGVHVLEIWLAIQGGEDWVYSFLPDGEGGFADTEAEVALKRLPK
jgi:peroxiredoxin